METQKIVVEKAFTLNGVTILPVVQIHSGFEKVRGGSAYYYRKKPLYIIISVGSSRQAFRISGEQIPLYRLSEAHPELRELLA